MSYVELSWRESQDDVIGDAMSMTTCVKNGGSPKGSRDFAETYTEMSKEEGILLNFDAVYEASEIARETRHLIDSMLL
jgi:hypothetical protein